METIWRDVPDYEGCYEVSNSGVIRNKKTGKVLKPSIKRNGYLSVDLGYKGLKTISVHRIVARAFIENANGYPCVNHKNENKLDNRVENLEWCSIKYNAWYGATRGSIKIPKERILTDEEEKEVQEIWRKEREKLPYHLKGASLKAVLTEIVRMKIPATRNMLPRSIQSVAYGLRYWKQPLTIPSECEKHHTHIVSEKGIVI